MVKMLVFLKKVKEEKKQENGIKEAQNLLRKSRK
jgi:hypothetical protein